MSILNDVKEKFPGLSWTVKGKNITFMVGGVNKKENQIADTLEAVGCGITVAQLKTAISNEEVTDRSEVVLLDLPPLESNLNADSDLNEADDAIWKDLKFVEDDHTIFYVKDRSDTNTYTAYLTAAGTSDKSDAKTLKEAYYGHSTDRPEQIVKALLKSMKINITNFDSIKHQLPVTAWKYLKIKAYKGQNGNVWESLVMPAGSTDKLYQGVLDFEAEFRTNGKHNIETPRPLTNNPNESAIACIDLKALNDNHKGETSKLWDDFLLQRLHNPEYVSIFKAWTYAIAVGKNNSRQEMWLHGNGGTGKSCLCKAFVRGFNKLAGKDICLAASKDTGKSNFNEELLNKHLLVYSDAKNLRGGMSEFKHNVTGGDVIRIEGKCKAATSAQIYLKCLTCSNELPKVDMTDRSQSSRYIVLPFTLDDDEMKKYGLMDNAGQIRGSSDFEDQLNAEFECFLASCKEHYEKRCPTNSNIDAHEALDELSAIQMDEVALIEEFVEQYFEITTNPRDKLMQTEFRKQCEFGINDIDSDHGVKIYKDIKMPDVRDYLEKKYAFNWKADRLNGEKKTQRLVVSKRYGIKLKQIENTMNTETDDVVFD